MKYFMKFILFILFFVTFIIILNFVLYNDEEQILLTMKNKFITFKWTNRWGIGNEMFALASTIGINAMLNKSRVVCLNGKAKIRKLFDLKEFPVCSADFLIHQMEASTYHEVDYAKFDPQVRLIPQNINVVLDRFFQSWKYFKTANKEIKKLFRFPEDLFKMANNKLMKEVRTNTKCVGGNCNNIETKLKIGVHVRRKDLDEEHLKKLGYTQAPRDYFKRAFEYFKNVFKQQNLIFVVCSDDIDWTEKHLKDLDENIAFINTGNPMIDLVILSSCDHSVISVGTFGWWGAWLANGTTVYFKDWPQHDSTLYHSTSHSDYFLKEWIPM